MRSQRVALVLTVSSVVVACFTGYHAGRDSRRFDPSACPDGFTRYEVRIGGQRLEAGIDPVTHQTMSVVTQNNAAADPRYVVASTCLRPLTGAERNPSPTP